MIKNPINYLIIEGPDLSGKTTLYNQIHKKTGYRWNIQDRSALSMVVHAKLYNRDEFSHIENLNNEINNLNNHMIILLPDWKIISKMINSLSEEPVDYLTSFDVTEELSKKIPGYGEITQKSIKKQGKTRAAVASVNGAAQQLEKIISSEQGLKLRISTLLFSRDKILDSSSALAHHFLPSTIHLHEDDATKLGLSNGDGALLKANGIEVEAIVEISNRCNPGAVVVPKVSDDQRLLGLVDSEPVSWVEVKKRSN